MAMSCRVKIIDDDSSTEPYIHIHSLTLYFPHLTKAEEKELEADRDLSQQAGCGYRLQPSRYSWLRWSLQEALGLNPLITETEVCFRLTMIQLSLICSSETCGKRVNFLESCVCLDTSLSGDFQNDFMEFLTLHHRPELCCDGY